MLTVKVSWKALKDRLAVMKAKAKEPNTVLWKLMGLAFGRMTTLQFVQSGGLWGRTKWLPISESMIGKIRYGTDLAGLTPKRKNGAAVRRFTASSKPLMASSGYMKSFRVQKADSRGFVFGSQLSKPGQPNLAVKIQHAGRGGRYVLPVWEDSSVQSQIKGVIAAFKKWVTK